MVCSLWLFGGSRIVTYTSDTVGRTRTADAARADREVSVHEKADDEGGHERCDQQRDHGCHRERCVGDDLVLQ